MNIEERGGLHQNEPCPWCGGNDVAIVELFCMGCSRPLTPKDVDVAAQALATTEALRNLLAWALHAEKCLDGQFGPQGHDSEDRTIWFGHPEYRLPAEIIAAQAALVAAAPTQKPTFQGSPDGPQT